MIKETQFVAVDIGDALATDRVFCPYRPRALPFDTQIPERMCKLSSTGQANVYLVRERHHFWHSRPSRWLALGTVVDVIVVSWLAAQGLLMTAVGLGLITELLVATIAFMIALDFLKISVFRHFINTSDS